MAHLSCLDQEIILLDYGIQGQAIVLARSHNHEMWYVILGYYVSFDAQ